MGRAESSEAITSPRLPASSDNADLHHLQSLRLITKVNRCSANWLSQHSDTRNALLLWLCSSPGNAIPAFSRQNLGGGSSCLPQRLFQPGFTNFFMPSRFLPSLWFKDVPRGGSSRAKPLPASVSFGKAGISPRCVKERQPQALISLPPRAEAPFSHLSLPTPSQGQTWPGPALPTGRLPRRQMFSINNKIRSRKAAEIERANPIRLEKKIKKILCQACKRSAGNQLAWCVSVKASGGIRVPGSASPPG